LRENKYKATTTKDEYKNNVYVNKCALKRKEYVRVLATTVTRILVNPFMHAKG
jgi:hypothetical protein